MARLGNYVLIHFHLPEQSGHSFSLPQLLRSSHRSSASVLLGQTLLQQFSRLSDKGEAAVCGFDGIREYLPLLVRIIFLTIRYGDRMRASVDIGFSD
jgi:hypothetical protein